MTPFINMKYYFVYIVLCLDNSYYTGITNNLEKRIDEHNKGIDTECYTFKRRPVVIKFFQEFIDVKNAITKEKQIKGWSRKKKEALINGNYKELIKLSKNHSLTSLRQAQTDIS